MNEASHHTQNALDGLRSIASKKATFICAGSMPVRNSNGLTNTSYLISDSGEILYEYDKCHLFDVQLPEITVSESRFFQPGKSTYIAETSIGAIGTLICYDIRFPELARKITLDGMQILCVPAAFSTTTGSAHWHTVMRARAIENQIYLCAASPARDPQSSYPAYGHSMIVDPWGKIMAEAKESETIIYADISLDHLADIRRKLPLLKHRQPNLY
jgi:predicted amidohydrolase